MDGLWAPAHIGTACPGTVNLIISPKIGVGVLDTMASKGIKYVFIQPGADGGQVLPRAAELGLTVQQGCVLVTPLPSL